MSTPSVNIPVEAAPAPAPRSSLFARIGNVFVSPGEVGEELRDNVSWAGALGLVVGAIVAMQVAAFFLITDQMFVDFVKGVLVEQGATQLPPDEMLMQNAKLQKGLGVVIAPIATLLQVFFGALVLWVMFSAVGGGKAGYGHYLAVVVHALFISLVGALILLPLQLNTGELDMKLSFALVGERLGMEPGGIVTMVLKQFEIFNLWTFAVVGIGVAAVNRWKGWVGPAGLVFFVYAAFAIGFGLIGKMFQQGG